MPPPKNQPPHTAQKIKPFDESGIFQEEGDPSIIGSSPQQYKPNFKYITPPENEPTKLPIRNSMNNGG